MIKASAIQAPVAPARRQAPTGEPAAGRMGRVILHTRAVFRTVQRSGWRPCHISLTPDGISLTQGGRLVLEAPARRIIGSRIERVRFVLARKEVLCIEYRGMGGRGKPSRLWLTGADIHALREKLLDLAPPLDQAAIESLFPRLDADAESIVRFLWDRRHATIRELAERTRMPSHMDILLAIREVINPVAEELLGFPLLTFASARHDPATGENVLNSWWTRCSGGGDAVKRPEILVDTFDEEDGFSILACLSCGQADEVRVSFSDGHVEISSGEQSRPGRASLPPGLEPKNCRQTFRNGVLELRWGRASMLSPAVEKREK